MSRTSSAGRLDVSAARDLTRPTPVVLVSRTDGSVVDRITLLRYAGHYRSGAMHTFAVRDSGGKFRLRSANQLGLTEGSAVEALIDTPHSSTHNAA